MNSFIQLFILFCLVGFSNTDQPDPCYSPSREWTHCDPDCFGYISDPDDNINTTCVWCSESQVKDFRGTCISVNGPFIHYCEKYYWSPGECPPGTNWGLIFGLIFGIGAFICCIVFCICYRRHNY